mmetsp:Transcript_8807/g.11841  ORF Transcript_8807/g.11841 Transcript_8807/m.11841 type:complete len:110 (-) Transcript_8807:15-344(-)
MDRRNVLRSSRIKYFELTVRNFSHQRTFIQIVFVLISMGDHHSITDLDNKFLFWEKEWKDEQPKKKKELNFAPYFFSKKNFFVLLAGWRLDPTKNKSWRIFKENQFNDS